MDLIRKKEAIYGNNNNDTVSSTPSIPKSVTCSSKEVKSSFYGPNSSYRDKIRTEYEI